MFSLIKGLFSTTLTLVFTGVPECLKYLNILKFLNSSVREEICFVFWIFIWLEWKKNESRKNQKGMKSPKKKTVEKNKKNKKKKNKKTHQGRADFYDLVINMRF